MFQEMPTDFELTVLKNLTSYNPMLVKGFSRCKLFPEDKFLNSSCKVFLQSLKLVVNKLPADYDLSESILYITCAANKQMQGSPISSTFFKRGESCFCTIS